MKTMAVNVPKTRVKTNIHWKHRFTMHVFNRHAWSLVRGVIIMGICFLIIYPTLVKMSVSIMSQGDLFDQTVRYVPKNFTLDNFRTAWRHLNYPVALLNSFQLSSFTSIMQLISCTLIGYGFARFKFKGRNLLFAMVLVTLIVPPQTIMIPLFLHFRFFDIFGIIEAVTGNRGVNLLDSYWPFILMSLTGMGLRNGLYIYIIRQFFRGMPKELEEAAYVDGAGLLRTFYTIMLPSALPAMLTVFLFSFVWQWNDTFYSNLFLQSLRVLPTALSGLADSIGQAYYWETGIRAQISPAVRSMYNNTGSLMVVVPLIIIYGIAQRHFVESIERSGIVG